LHDSESATRHRPSSRVRRSSETRSCSRRSLYTRPLPIGPPGAGNSPYSSPSTFAGSPLLVSLELLASKGADGYYKGAFAKKLVAGVRQLGGNWTEADLTNYKVVERPPVVGHYRGARIVSGSPPTSGGIALIDALSACGLRRIQVGSFVNPKHVPGWADAEAVIEGFTQREGVEYSALWFNERGLQRALAFREKLTLAGFISLSASEPFAIKNLNRDRAGQIEAMHKNLRAHREAGVPISKMVAGISVGLVQEAVAVEHLRESVDAQRHREGQHGFP
jgi:hypothetical protein